MENKGTLSAWDKVKLLPLILGMFASFILGFFGFNLYYHHNVGYTDDDGTYFGSKVDGICSYTEIEASKGGKVKVSNYYCLSSARFYYDEDGDGKVDNIFVKAEGRAHRWLDLYRGRHYGTHRKYFDQADSDLKRQMERFGDLLSKANEQRGKKGGEGAS